MSIQVINMGSATQDLLNTLVEIASKNDIGHVKNDIDHVFTMNNRKITVVPSNAMGEWVMFSYLLNDDLLKQEGFEYDDESKEWMVDEGDASISTEALAQTWLKKLL